MGDKLCDCLIFAGPITPVLSLGIYYGINYIHLLEVQSLPCDCSSTNSQLCKNISRSSVLRLIRATYEGDLTLPSSTLINLMQEFFTGELAKLTSSTLLMVTAFHQFYLTWLKLHHGLIFAVNPWVSSAHRPLSILFSHLINHEPDVILGFDLYENRILRMRVLYHLSDRGMQIVIRRLFLRVLVQKYLLFRFIHVKNKLF